MDSKHTHEDTFKIKRLKDDAFECSFVNAFAAAQTKFLWRKDGNVYLDNLGTGAMVAQAQKGGTLHVAGGVDMLTVVALAVVARTWTGKGRCACGVI